MTPREQTIVAATVPQINEDEGFRARAYLDTRGVWTWGYGDTRHGVGPGKSCTIEQARQWRDDYLAELAGELSFHIPWWSGLSVARAAALLNMAYQLGLGGLQKFRLMLWALREGDYDLASREALSSKWADQTPARAKRIAAVLGPQPSPADIGPGALMAAISHPGDHA